MKRQQSNICWRFSVQQTYSASMGVVGLCQKNYPRVPVREGHNKLFTGVMGLNPGGERKKFLRFEKSVGQGNFQEA